MVKKLIFINSRNYSFYTNLLFVGTIKYSWNFPFSICVGRLSNATVAAAAVANSEQLIDQIPVSIIILSLGMKQNRNEYSERIQESINNQWAFGDDPSCVLHYPSQVGHADTVGQVLWWQFEFS